MPFSLTPEQYGHFLKDVFDLWYTDWRQGDYVSIRTFDSTVEKLLNCEQAQRFSGQRSLPPPRVCCLSLHILVPHRRLLGLGDKKTYNGTIITAVPSGHSLTTSSPDFWKLSVQKSAAVLSKNSHILNLAKYRRKISPVLRDISVRKSICFFNLFVRNAHFSSGNPNQPKMTIQNMHKLEYPILCFIYKIYMHRKISKVSAKIELAPITESGIL